MLGKPSPKAQPVVRFAEPPWNEQSAPWRQIDTPLSSNHLAREIRQAMTHLDLTELYDSYAGRGKAPHRPDLMLAIVCLNCDGGSGSPASGFKTPKKTVRCGGWAMVSVPHVVAGMSFVTVLGLPWTA